MSRPGRKKPSKNQWDKRRITVAVVAGLMALLLLVPFVTQIFELALAVDASDVADMRDQVKVLQQQQKQLQSQIDDLKGQVDSKLSEKMLLEQQISILEEQIAVQESIIADYDTQIAEKEVDLEAAREKESEYYALFCQRVRSMEEEGTVSYWEILFSAADFSDLLDRINFIQEIGRYDRMIVDGLAEARAEVETIVQDLEQKRQEQQDEKDQLQSQQDQLAADEAAVDAAIAEIQAKQDEYADQMAALEADEDALEKDIAKAERELSAAAVPIGNGGYLWPCPSSGRVTSSYAWRNCPYHGRELHGGVDIGASSGANVLASKGGTVLISTYSSSYGNYIVLGHSDGTRTLYAHMKSRAVQVGATVTQGQIIGYVGSTGNSTGPHLHFEVWQGSSKSSRVDPMQYF